VATRLSAASRNAATNAVVAVADADVGAGTIQIRTGAQPATADLAATGTLLATLTMADPSFGASAAGVATLDATPVLSTTGVAAGTAGWFRMLDNSGDTVLDGEVTVTGGGGEMELNTTTISIGVVVEVTAGTLTTPAST